MCVRRKNGAGMDDATASAGVVEEAHSNGTALLGAKLDRRARQRGLGSEPIAAAVSFLGEGMFCVHFGGGAESRKFP